MYFTQRTSLVILFLPLLLCHSTVVIGHNSNVTIGFEATADTDVRAEVISQSNIVIRTSDLAMLVTESYLNATMTTVIDNSFWTSNVSGHISKARFEAIKETLWLYVVPVILPIGILGSILGVWFLVHRRYKQSFDLFLLALISSDLVYLIITLLQSAIIIMEVYNKELAETVNCYSGNVIRVLKWNTYSTCTHLVCLMAFERLIHVLLPFWRRNENFRKQTITIIFTIIVTNVTLRIPALIQYVPRHVADPQTNVTNCKLVETTWAKENLFWHEQYIVVMLAITQIAPLIATILANVSIIIFLSRQREQRAELFAKKETRGQQYQQYITTLTLIILSVCLTTSLLPSITMNIMGFYLPETYGRTGTERFTAALVSEIGYFLRVISSSTDFVVYIWLSTSSRMRFIRMIKKKLGCETEENSFNDLDTNAKSVRGTGETSFND